MRLEKAGKDLVVNRLLGDTTGSPRGVSCSQLPQQPIRKLTDATGSPRGVSCSQLPQQPIRKLTDATGSPRGNSRW